MRGERATHTFDAAKNLVGKTSNGVERERAEFVLLHKVVQTDSQKRKHHADVLSKVKMVNQPHKESVQLVQKLN